MISHFRAAPAFGAPFLALVAALFFAPNLPANAHTDPVTTFGVAGAVAPVRGGAQVRMVWQEVRVELPSRRVRVRAALKNDGAATVVALGLPEEGDVLDGPFPDEGHLRNRRSLVDGAPVRVRRGLIGPQPGRWETYYHFIWTSDVRFARGQTRIIEHQFQCGRHFELDGAPEGGATQLFDFNLSRAAAWKGPIGRCRVVFDVAGLSDFTDLKFSPATVSRRGEEVVWERRNFEPTADFSVGASWWPGIRNVRFNGEPVFPRAQIVGCDVESGEYRLVYPQRRNHSIWVPMRLVSQWLPPAPRDKFSDGQMSQGAYRAFRGIYWNGLNIGTEIGTPYLDISGGDYQGRAKMSAPSFDQDGTTMVELAPLVLALGGQVFWNEKDDSLRVVLKPSR